MDGFCLIHIHNVQCLLTIDNLSWENKNTDNKNISEHNPLYIKSKAMSVRSVLKFI